MKSRTGKVTQKFLLYTDYIHCHPLSTSLSEQELRIEMVGGYSKDTDTVMSHLLPVKHLPSDSLRCSKKKARSIWSVLMGTV